MQKILLILICLFVSFEVKSESDDLSGLRLICKPKIEIPTIYGFKFSSNDKSTLLIMRKNKEGFEISSIKSNYKSNISYIWVYPIDNDKIKMNYDISIHRLSGGMSFWREESLGNFPEFNCNKELGKLEKAMKTNLNYYYMKQEKIERQKIIDEKKRIENFKKNRKF